MCQLDFFQWEHKCTGAQNKGWKCCSTLQLELRVFLPSIFQFELHTKAADSNVWLQNESLSRADVGSRSGLQPLSWPVSSGSMFTGLAQAASWKEIKASERTTDSSLITTSLSFTNTSGTNYALYCLQAAEGQAQNALWWAGEIVCQICFFPLMLNPEQAKEKREKEKKTQGQGATNLAGFASPEYMRPAFSKKGREWGSENFDEEKTSGRVETLLDGQ